MKTLAKRDRLASEFRRRIVRGELQPGSQLPTRRELIAEYNLSLDTVNGALNTLMRDGFVQTRGTAGTFVSHTPPSCCQYGMVFPFGTERSRFSRAVSEQAREMELISERRFRQYYDLNPESSDYRQRSWPALESGLRRELFAGLIYVDLLHDKGGPLARHTQDVPRVVIAPQTDLTPGLSAVWVDNASFWERGLRWLVDRGRRRLGVICLGGGVADVGHMIAQANKHGMESHRRWVLGLGYDRSEWAANATELLLSLPADQRPDALIITDDNLVEGTTQGVADSGLRSGVDLDIVAHCNFPHPPPSMVPVTRLGYDVRQILNQCVSNIDRHRGGEAVEPVTLVPAIFGDEISGRLNVQPAESYLLQPLKAGESL